MRIVSFLKIKDFTLKYPDAEIALKDWYSRTKGEDWTNLVDIKNSFNSVDYVGNNRFVFNIKGNHYRLVAIIIFASQKVYIRFIGTHSQYDKINASEI
ncbi:type II toxin-antitoxin system HigB family toxin [Kaistella antarctica]|uniref:Toxin RelE n=1 Tax=Kaistella antarctica TaxID=266748 RepID=A0A3S5EUY4_9FLAO|nr:type II toxin-antitoxin system HigB family toxin [Kaistella antarctica]KEY18414.1 toxin RelE [Kaistella antarctica]SEV85548.1 mRNA interferase HigB [Kaistella antarctica]VEI01155.1 mRNA interferase HigB [Kaistella antarctica]